MSSRRHNPSSVSAQMRPPRLVLLFSVLTALGVAAAAAVILVVVRQADDAHAEAHASERAQFVARSVLAPALRAPDVEGRVSTRRKRDLDRVLNRRASNQEIRSATLYNANRRATYSWPKASGGGVQPDRLDAALAGATLSETVGAADGSTVLRSYVPVAATGGRVAGVVVVEQEYGPIPVPVGRSLGILAVLEGLLVLLLVGLVPVLARASSRIGGHVAELEHVATHDDLTGLPNRYGLGRAIDATFAEASAAAIMLVDLDGFSELNASLGSECGDRVLVEAAERIQREVAPDGATVARFGDDEFCVFSPDTNALGAEWIAQRIRRCFSDPFVIDGVRLAIDVDVGIGLSPGHGDDVATVLGCAAAALVAAKNDSRSGVQVYDAACATDTSCRLTVAAELRDALDTGQLCVHYQPQLDLLTHHIRGVEALVRWRHPTRGLIAAGEFICHLERSGLSQELRRFVLWAAARQWHEWHARGVELELAVNIGGVDMLDPALPDEIEEVLGTYGMPPRELVLEVTERTLVADERRAHQVVDELERIGVRLAVDDFGTGYSSLASLRAFSAHQVKLDRSLLADVPGDEAAEAMVGGSVEIAHGLGALVVAEGVETHEQLRFASAVGCDLAQGYLVGVPAPAAEILALVDIPRIVPLSA